MTFNPWAVHVCMEVPVRKGGPYGGIFRGANEMADLAIQRCTPTVAGFMPLWKGLLDAPMTEVEGVPFVWKCGGVEYRSGCAAFEKNMLFAQGVTQLWNSSFNGAASDQLDRLKEAQALLTHLLQRGLDDDRSLPSDTRLQPKCLVSTPQHASKGKTLPYT